MLSDLPDLESEYQGFMRDDLKTGRELAAQRLIETVRDKAISKEDAEIWMRSLNDIRLYLGTQLNITEDWHDEVSPDHPLAQQFGIYGLLTHFVGALVEAVMADTEDRDGDVDVDLDALDADGFVEVDEFDDEDDDDDDEYNDELDDEYDDELDDDDS